MEDERRKWINKFLEIHEFGNLPNSIADFYKMKKKEEDDSAGEKGKDKKSKDDKGKGKKSDV